MSNKSYDVAIIGAGIGGLVCGCYLAKAGLKVLIVEQHSLPGGYCSSFFRKGYSFDVGVHYLGGLKRGILQIILSELHLNETVKFNKFYPSDKIITPEGSVYIRQDAQKTLEELITKFPDEETNIKRFFQFITQDDFLRIFLKTRNLSFKDVLDDFFTDKRLKYVLSALLRNIGLCANEASALSFIVLLREYVLDPGYYPQGGMQKFSDALAERFRTFQGNLMFSKRVVSIHTNQLKATAIECEDGDIFRARHIVSNVDAFKTFNSLLGIKTNECEKLNSLTASSSAFVVWVGMKKRNIKADFCNTWPFFSYNLNKPPILTKRNIMNGNTFVTMISFPSTHNEAISSDKLTMGIFSIVNYETKSFWQSYRKTFTRDLITKTQKDVNFNEKDVEVIETATPLTFERYTSNHLGSAFGWASTVDQINVSACPMFTSIKNLFIVGHWCTVGTGQGGIPKVAFTGRKLASMLIKQEGKSIKLSEYVL